MQQSLHLWPFIIICSAPSAITCGHPGNPANGRTNGSEFNLNDVVNFTCNRGYVLSGSARAQCRLNGQWSSSLPVCKGHQLSYTTSPDIPANAFFFGSSIGCGPHGIVLCTLTHSIASELSQTGEGKQPEKTLK